VKWDYSFANIAIGKGVVGALAIATALVLSGCGPLRKPLAPSAHAVAEHITLRDESPQATQRWLMARGFRQIARSGYGGVWPKTGPCYQTAKGIFHDRRTITRVCFAGGRVPVVLVRQTDGYYWTEVYPSDLSHNLYGPSGLGAISDETIAILGN